MYSVRSDYVELIVKIKDSFVELIVITKGKLKITDATKKQKSSSKNQRRIYICILISNESHEKAQPTSNKYYGVRQAGYL